MANNRSIIYRLSYIILAATILEASEGLWGKVGGVYTPIYKLSF